MFDLAPADFTKALLVGMGLVAAGMALSFVLGLALGGFKVGSLRREMQIEVPAADFATFWTQAYQRIMSLGFGAGEAAGHFVQGGASFLNPRSHTHAKTRKRLTVETLEQTATTVTLRFSLAYLDPIVGDTGESAYRDAVLDGVHIGFAAFNSYLERARPRFMFHGHQHVNRETIQGDTLVVGVFGLKLLDLAVQASQAAPATKHP
jgi:hypothetical protein